MTLIAFVCQWHRFNEVLTSTLKVGKVFVKDGLDFQKFAQNWNLFVSAPLFCYHLCTVGQQSLIWYLTLEVNIFLRNCQRR